MQFSSFDTTKYKNRYKLGFETNFKGVGIPGFEFYVGWTSNSLKSTESEKLKAFCVTQNFVYFHISNAVNRQQHL